MTELYIGVDGGGTHTSAVSVRPDGRILARAAGSGLNFCNDGLDTCVSRFGEILARLLPAGPACRIVVCAGLAALDGPAPPDILSAFQAALPPGCRLILESDLTVALAGLTLGRPGLMAVCGTGSMVMVRNAAGQEQAAGGWGWKIGDPGSGYMLAREGLFRALWRLETEKRETPLLTAAFSFSSVPDSRSLLTALYPPGSGVDTLAAFGAEVVRLAEEGDPDALDILTRQMQEISALAASLLKSVPEAKDRVGLYGGVFQHSALARSLFSEALSARIPEVCPCLPEYPPVLGAVILAMLREGLLSGSLPAFTDEP